MCFVIVVVIIKKIQNTRLCFPGVPGFFILCYLPEFMRFLVDCFSYSRHNFGYVLIVEKCLLFLRFF